jgi:hypothetical protein
MNDRHEMMPVEEGTAGVPNKYIAGDTVIAATDESHVDG